MSSFEDKVKARGGRSLGKVGRNAGLAARGKAHLPDELFADGERLTPSKGKRPGRPTDPSWSERPKVPMSAVTMQALRDLAEEQSARSGQRVTAAQVAARLLERAVQRTDVSTSSTKAEATSA